MSPALSLPRAPPGATVERDGAMAGEPASTLDKQRDRLERAVPWAPALLQCLERDHFTVTHVRPAFREVVWFIRAVPPDPLQTGLGLAPEILIIAVRGAMQARELDAARKEVIHSGLRLDPNLVVVADEGAGLQERLARIGGHGQRVAWEPTAGSTWPPLADVLRAKLPTFDAYEERDAVRGAQLVGRSAEVAELRTRMTRGDAVGLFGLRKMGKTSLMRAVTDWFDPASGVRAVEGDLSPPDPGVGVAVVIDAGLVLERDVDAVADELLNALRRRMRAAGETLLDVSGSGLVAWKSAAEQILDHGRPLCIVIDEYDLLFEGESGESAIPGIGRLFRLIRGWAQTRQGQVSMLMVGRDPTYLGAPELDGVTNPLTAWCTPQWIGPLARPQANELLRKLGKRVGLDVGHESAALALRWTGGHPLLHRQFGSALRKVTRDHDSRWNAPTDTSIAQAPEEFCGREAVLDVMREIVALLKKRYPSALTVLRELTDDAWDPVIARHGGRTGQPANVLRSFGIADADRPLAEILRWYLASQISIRGG